MVFFVFGRGGSGGRLVFEGNGEKTTMAERGCCVGELWLLWSWLGIFWSWRSAGRRRLVREKVSFFGGWWPRGLGFFRFSFFVFPV